MFIYTNLKYIKRCVEGLSLFTSKVYEGCLLLLACSMGIWRNGMEKTRPLPACVYHYIRSSFTSGKSTGYVSGEERSPTE